MVALTVKTPGEVKATVGLGSELTCLNPKSQSTFDGLADKPVSLKLTAEF